MMASISSTMRWGGPGMPKASIKQAAPSSMVMDSIARSSASFGRMPRAHR